MFEVITESIKNSINKIRFSNAEVSLNNALTQLRKSFLKADIHHKTTKEILNSIDIKTKQKGISQKSFISSLKEVLNDILTTTGNQGFVHSSKPPTTILMTGLQGSGKTTSTGKLANYLKIKNKKVLVAAADLQRFGAIEQLEQICQEIEVDIYSNKNEKDSIKIIKEAKQKAINDMYDVLLIDTAGRLAIDENLMNELKNITNSINIDEIFYVADSLSGQDASRTAISFNNKLKLDGIILSKYDGDTKGGVALSISHQTKIPLRFIGTGEKMPDFEVFIPSRIVNRLLDEGDIEGLAEKTSSIIDNKEAKKVASKIKKGQFNFDDFLKQLDMMKKLGSMKSLISMMPGMSQMKSSIKDIDFENSDELKKIKALISSMTKKERLNPELLNISRKKRLSIGSGLNEMQVNRILKQFKHASKMAKKLSGKNGMKDLQNMISNNGKSNFP